MAINFPDSPTLNQTFQQADRAWQWDGEKWKATGTTSSSTVGASVVFEGSTDDAFETTLAATDPTADRTITLPNASGTVAFTSDLSSYAPLASPAFTGTATMSGDLTVDTSTLKVDSNDRVGIGTASPAALLHLGVDGETNGVLALGVDSDLKISAGNNSFIDHNGNQNFWIRTKDAEQDLYLASYRDLYLASGSGHTTHLTVSDTGVVSVNPNGTYPVVIGVGNRSTPNGSNIAVGTGALAVVTSNDNVAIGINALNDCTTSGWNVAIGHHALGLTTTQSGHPNYAQYNVAVGHEALYGYVHNSGSSVAVGFRAGKGATTGVSNPFIGMQAAQGATTGSNNTCLGYNSAPSSSTASNEVTLGDSSISNLRCQDTSISAVSDERDKTNIQDLDMGLEFIRRLQPRRFEWNMRDGGKVGVEETGFVAQELQQAMADEGKVIPNLVRDYNPDKLEASPGTLLPAMVLAIQELADKVEALT